VTVSMVASARDTAARRWNLRRIIASFATACLGVWLTSYSSYDGV
jgi:hypothetical protein